LQVQILPGIFERAADSDCQRLFSFGNVSTYGESIDDRRSMVFILSPFVVVSLGLSA
jgi:hypothetical protein